MCEENKTINYSYPFKILFFLNFTGQADWSKVHDQYIDSLEDKSNK